MLFYRILMAILAPFVALFLFVRLARGKENAQGIGERFGYVPIENGDQVLWFHGASLGELTAAKPLIDVLMAEFEAVTIIVTANTYTGRDLARGWGNPRIKTFLAPLDFKSTTRRFLEKTRPVAALTLENEVWPTRVHTLAGQGIPILIISGRLSASAAASWKKFPVIAQSVMNNVSFLAPLDADNAQRFEDIGLDRDRIGAPLNLKSAVTLPAPDLDEMQKFKAVFDRGNTFLAASTHAGEEAIIIAEFASALKKNPTLRLIIAPRHPARANDVATLLSDQGLGFARRSNQEIANVKDAVYLADTIGEMSLWYSLAGITIVGGTFVDNGGHTPFEPMQFASLVAHGPYTTNHQAAFEALEAAQGSFPIQHPSELEKLFARALPATEAQQICKRALRALGALAETRSDTQPIVAFLQRNVVAGKIRSPQLLD